MSFPPHVERYLAQLDNRPEYFETLSLDLKRRRDVNVIYKVDDIFYIHIYRPAPDEMLRYIVVRPEVPSANLDVIDAVEEMMARHIEADLKFSSPEELAKYLESLIDKVVEVDDGVEGYKVAKGKVRMRRELLDAVKHMIVMEHAYLGVLEPLLRDPYIEDITCPGLGPIVLVHKVFGACKTNIEFHDIESLDRFIARLAERSKRPVSLRKPIVDASLPDGSRINIVYSTEVSLKGSNFTIRKFSKVPLSITQLISGGNVSPLSAAYLWMLLDNSMSVWVCGETASGKTTLLNAIIPFIRYDLKIVTIEDTPELFVPHDNWVREVTREGGEGEKITLFDLLRAALRQRPNYIIVGEIRGAEAYVAFQAMQTGHPVMATFHAGSVEKLIQRLTGDPINIPKTFVDSLNAVVINSAVRVPKTRSLERRALSINEIVGYDASSDSISYVAVFEWDPVEDQHIFRGVGMSYLLEAKIAEMKGLTGRDVRKIYDELFIRANFLEALVKLRVFNYFDVFKALKYAQNYGVETALDKLMSGEQIWR